MLENFQRGTVNKAAVAEYFQTSEEALSQPYRNIVGRVERDGKHCFLKLATKSGTISQHNQNEAEIYRRRNSQNYPLPVKTSRLVETGVYQQSGEQLTWFITEYIESEEVLSQGSIDLDLFQQYLPIIVSTAVAIMNWPQEPLMPLDIPKENVVRAVMEKVNGWINARLSTPEAHIKAAKAYELRERFFAKENVLSEVLETGPSHGDFVPNNFRVTQTGEVYLVDMENARMQWLKFYDSAYMYHRLYTKFKRPDLAQAFLKQFIDTGSFNENEQQSLRIALAQRLIGGYFDAIEDGVTDWKLQDELSEKILRED